jgi:hypothetical protein
MRRRFIQTLVAVPVASVFVASNAGQLTGSPAPFVTVVATGEKASRPGRHIGFDTYAYPGDEIMQAWRHRDVPFEWVGYYLPAPCHDGRTWVGKRERLADMGWGMAVIYVGQQTWDRTPTGYETHYKSVRRTSYVSKRVKVYRTVNGKRVARYVTKKVPVKRTVRVPVKTKVDPLRRDIHDCNAQLVGATRGRLEAADAIRRTEAEGFPRGTVIFLDVEYMRAIPERMRGYYNAWTAAVLADGRYVPGYYTHTKNAATIYRDVKAVYAKAGRTAEPPFWIAGPSKEFTHDKAPQDVGHHFAHMWQGLLDVVQTHAGYRMALDVNVAEVPDPSHRYVAAD